MNYTSFPYIFDIIEYSHNNMNMKNTIEVSTIYWKLQSIQQKIPCFVEIKSNKKFNMWYIKIESIVSPTKYLHLSLLQNYVFKNENPFPRTPSLGSP
jgi:hypothetical protein